MEKKLITISINGDKFIEYKYFIDNNQIKLEKIKQILIPVPFSKQQREEILDKIEKIIFEV